MQKCAHGPFEFEIMEKLCFFSGTTVWECFYQPAWICISSNATAWCVVEEVNKMFKKCH